MSNYFSFHYNFSPIVNIPLDCVRMRWDEMIHKILASLKLWDIPFHWEHISMTEQHSTQMVPDLYCSVQSYIGTDFATFMLDSLDHFSTFYCVLYFWTSFFVNEANHLFRIKFSKFANSSIHSEVLQMIQIVHRCVVFPFSGTV